MTTTTLITSALIGRARERSMSLAFAPASTLAVHAYVAAKPSVDACVSATAIATIATTTIATTTTAMTAMTAMTATTAPDAAVTNLWLGGFHGKGFGSGAYGTKRIRPGRLEGMT